MKPTPAGSGPDGLATPTRKPPAGTTTGVRAVPSGSESARMSASWAARLARVKPRMSISAAEGLCSSMNSEPSELNSLMRIRPAWCSGVTGMHAPALHVSTAGQRVVVGVCLHTPTSFSSTQLEAWLTTEVSSAVQVPGGGVQVILEHGSPCAATNSTGGRPSRTTSPPSTSTETVTCFVPAPVDTSTALMTPRASVLPDAGVSVLPSPETSRFTTASGSGELSFSRTVMVRVTPSSPLANTPEARLTSTVERVVSGRGFAVGDDGVETGSPPQPAASVVNREAKTNKRPGKRIWENMTISTDSGKPGARWATYGHLTLYSSFDGISSDPHHPRASRLGWTRDRATRRK